MPCHLLRRSVVAVLCEIARVVVTNYSRDFGESCKYSSIYHFQWFGDFRKTQPRHILCLAHQNNITPLPNKVLDWYCLLHWLSIPLPNLTLLTFLTIGLRGKYTPKESESLPELMLPVSFTSMLGSFFVGPSRLICCDLII